MVEEKYEIIEFIGDGSFGNVFWGRERATQELVAIKKMKTPFKTWEDAMSMPEVKCLVQLQHPNIVKLKEVLRSSHSKELYLVFDLLSTDLHELIKKRRKSENAFKEQEIKAVMFSILKGISYIHRRGFFHRDLKPDNVLID